MIRRKDGRFSVTISLPADRTYRYRYLIDGDHWENDQEAEKVHNPFGTEDCLLSV